MSSWYSSWFAALPTFDFAVPSTIQRRFFSFVLRRTLGRFLRPGQFDLHQIDSQLGSGVVHVTDLELDGQAINELLVGLPFSLHDGFISGVTARVPFPNPLTSSVGLHIRSLQLTLYVTAEQQASSPISPLFSGSALADSVASVAETFVHRELTPREEATLRESLNATPIPQFQSDEDESLPGGFHSFPGGQGDIRGSVDGDSDPAGVSVFAIFIERLLARFEFSALDTKITLVHPGHSSFTFTIQEILYRTDGGGASPPRLPADNKSAPETSEQESRGQVRTMTFSGLSVTSRNLRPLANSPTSTAGPLSPVSDSPNSPDQCINPLSPSSSSSSLDEETQLMMSQSIAMLPPRPLSPLSTASSSMYQSAISTGPQPMNQCISSRPYPTLMAEDELHVSHRPSAQVFNEGVLLSFGSQPITIQLRTPPPNFKRGEQQRHTNEGRSPSHDPEVVCEAPSGEVLELSVSMGTLTCALRACHVRMLLDLVDACKLSSSLPPPPPVQGNSQPSPVATLGLRVHVSIRGIVVIILSEARGGQTYSLSSYFEHPFTPPRLCCTYVRLLLDDINGTLHILAPASLPSGTSATLSDESTPARVRAVISDISLLAFHAVSAAEDPQVAAPLMITDCYLPVLERASHHRCALDSTRPVDARLPVFDVTDWTQAKHKGRFTRLSTWRTRPRWTSEMLRNPSKADDSSSPNPFKTNPLITEGEKLLPPAIEVTGQFSTSGASSLDTKIAPLHVFLDLDMILGGGVLSQFVNEVTSSSMFASPSGSRTPHAAGSSSPHGSGDHRDSEEGPSDRFADRASSAQVREREVERMRLEKLVLDDLNLGIEYGVTLKDFKSSKVDQARPKAPKTKVLNGRRLSASLSCAMIRVEARCLPPPGRSPRSGCLLLDIHDLLISNAAISATPPLRFSEGVRTLPQHAGIWGIQLQEILAAYAMVGETRARTFFVLGCMPSDVADEQLSTLLAPERSSDPIPVRLALGRTTVQNHGQRAPSSRLSVTVDIPLINLVLEKGTLDGLQYWADDVAQLIERSASFVDDATESLPSRNPSLIGSRFFAKSRNPGSRSSGDSTINFPIHQTRADSGEVAAKVNVTEALVRVLLPRGDCNEDIIRPFDLQASDIDILLELRPNGRDETVVTSSIMDLHVVDTLSNGNYTPLVILTLPRSLSAAPRPMVKVRVTSLVVPETTAKESRIRVSLWGITCRVPPSLHFATDLASFAKAPAGVFESVVPSERTVLTVVAVEVSVQLQAPNYPGAAVVHVGEADFSTELVGSSPETGFKLNVSSLHCLVIDSITDAPESPECPKKPGMSLWKNLGYALVFEVVNCHVSLRSDNSMAPSDTKVVINPIELRVHLCADTLGAFTGFINSLVSNAQERSADTSSDAAIRAPNTLTVQNDQRMIASLDENAFRKIPEVGSAADMINDDLPANLDYLDASFGAAAGLRELRDEDLEDFDTQEQSGRTTPMAGETGVVSNVGGETIRIFRKLSFKEHHFDTLTPVASGTASNDETTLSVRVYNADITLSLHDGYDWPRTRKIIEKRAKEMRKRLARIRQLVATGQTQQPIEEETSAMLFNSIHIGLEQDLENMDPDTLIAAIDSELDDAAETGSQSSWESLHPTSPDRARVVPARMHGKRLTRSKGPSVEICLSGLVAEVDHYRPKETLVSRTLVMAKDIEIFDHIKTSTWKKFLTSLRSDSHGNIRETDSNMARVELLTVRPSPYHPAEEARLRARFLPLRLYVDQDALDFFKKFFAFEDPESPAVSSSEKQEIYLQHAEVFPVDIKLDYKPRRVDYRALREGRTIELMNFFHFDGAEMTLRHLTLHGITGWPRFFDTLNDLWTPDVKATQLVDVISGVAPIRSVVNVGSGVADLVLLPIAQYKKDGRIVRGVQKGTKAFVQSAAMEAIKLGARLATGTQVILEQAESVLGGQFRDPVTAETLQIPYEEDGSMEEELISRYAAQPAGVTEGVQSAYHSLRKGLHSAAQTILAVPMEVYERSGNEGAVRAVIRAVPIAVLKPMIGASEAVSKTLMGLHNTLDPNVRHENEAKYKRR